LCADYDLAAEEMQVAEKLLDIAACRHRETAGWLMAGSGTVKVAWFMSYAATANKASEQRFQRVHELGDQGQGSVPLARCCGGGWRTPS
jgi:hypothetical protein